MGGPEAGLPDTGRAAPKEPPEIGAPDTGGPLLGDADVGALPGCGAGLVGEIAPVGPSALAAGATLGFPTGGNAGWFEAC